MINIAICDDDKVILSEIKNLLLNIAEKNFIKIDVILKSNSYEIYVVIWSKIVYTIIVLCLNEL